MGVAWKEEGTAPQIIVIERIFEQCRSRTLPPPRVQLFRRNITGRRHAREPNGRAAPVALVIQAPRDDGRRIVELVTPSGQAFLYALTDDEKAEVEEMEA